MVFLTKKAGTFLCVYMMEMLPCSRDCQDWHPSAFFFLQSPWVSLFLVFFWQKYWTYKLWNVLAASSACAMKHQAQLLSHGWLCSGEPTCDFKYRSKEMQYLDCILCRMISRLSLWPRDISWAQCLSIFLVWAVISCRLQKAIRDSSHLYNDSSKNRDD